MLNIRLLLTSIDIIERNLRGLTRKKSAGKAQEKLRYGNIEILL